MSTDETKEQCGGATAEATPIHMTVDHTNYSELNEILEQIRAMTDEGCISGCNVTVDLSEGSISEITHFWGFAKVLVRDRGGVLSRYVTHLTLVGPSTGLEDQETRQRDEREIMGMLRKLGIGCPMKVMVR